MTDCIFCKIVAGQIPAAKVYEDDRFLAFMDINPQSRGHCLLIPKEHHQTLVEMPDELLQGLIALSKRLGRAAMQGLKADGLSVIQANGKAACQIIPHYHMHLIPRWDNDGLALSDWEMVPGDPAVIAQAAEDLKKAL